MTRFIEASVVIVALLIARRILYAWLKQPDTLPHLLRQGLDVLLGYFGYVTLGLLGLSFVSGRGFREGGTPVAIVLIIAGALYVGVGVGALWWFMNKREPPKKNRRR